MPGPLHRRPPLRIPLVPAARVGFVVTTYRIHLVNREHLELTTDVDVIDQLRTQSTWIDAGSHGFLNPGHVTRIQILAGPTSRLAPQAA